MAEFQCVVIAADEGATLFPLSEDIPPALLPVNNRPIISFQLELLEHSGFTEIIVLCLEEHADKIRAVTRKFVAASGNVRVNVETLPQVMGTADALRTIKEQLTKDFVVISADLITNQVRACSDRRRRGREEGRKTGRQEGWTVGASREPDLDGLCCCVWATPFLTPEQ